MKRLVLFDKATGDTRGFVTLATDSDAALYPGAIEIPLDHPGYFNQAAYHVVDGKLVPKSNG